MPSFILRGLDPDFWSCVQTKAKREGTTVKALILRLLAAWLAAVVLLSAGCAYKSPDAPTPIDVVAAVPASVTVSTTAGFGNSAGTVYVIAQVNDARGKGVSAVVHFSSSNGTMQPDTVTADVSGQAQTKLLTNTPATITATAGAVTSTVDVTPIAVVVVAPPPAAPAPNPAPPTPAPAPSPAPPGTPLPAPFIAFAPLTTKVGEPALFTVGSFMAGGTPITDELWDFGNGASVQIHATATTYVYPVAGLYTVTVTAQDTLGRRASSSALVTVNALPLPPTPLPTPLPFLSASMNCTPVAHGTSTACNVAASYGGAPISSGAITRIDWDWGDGHSHITTGPLDAWPYVQAGTYLIQASVSANTIDGPKQTTVSKSVVIP